MNKNISQYVDVKIIIKKIIATDLQYMQIHIS